MAKIQRAPFEEFEESIELKAERDRLIEQARIHELIDKERHISNLYYARKEFEKAIVWFIAIVVGAVLMAILNGVFK